MFLHLGQNTVVKKSSIIGIFDIENTTVSKGTKNFLRKAQGENRVINVSLELPKSFIVAADKRRGKDEILVYISSISPATLKGRANEYLTERE